MLDLVSNENFLNSLINPLLYYFESNDSRILLIELLLKIEVTHILKSDSLFVIHDCKVGLVFRERCLTHLVLVVAMPRVKFIVYVDLEGKYRLEKDYESQVKLSAFVEQRVIDVLLGNFGACFYRSQNLIEIVSNPRVH